MSDNNITIRDADDKDIKAITLLMNDLGYSRLADGGSNGFYPSQYRDWRNI